MRSIVRLLVCCISLIFLGGVAVRAQDAKGCKDLPVITRFPGSILSSCKDTEFDQADLPMAGKPKHVEGDYHFLNYNPKPGVTPIQLFRNIETALKTAGFAVDYESSPLIITAHHGSAWFYMKIHDTGGAAPTVYMYEETLVTEKQMVQEVTASADTLSSELTAQGHAHVPGIYFESGKAEVKPESDAALKEVAKLLQQNPALKLYVVGHTDNVGARTANVTLSNLRAAAVMKALTTQYSVAASRLEAFGDGPYAPVASNDSDEGRALNRRVELVKQ